MQSLLSTLVLFAVGAFGWLHFTAAPLDTAKIAPPDKAVTLKVPAVTLLPKGKTPAPITLTESRHDLAARLRSATVRVYIPALGQGSGFCRRLSDGSVWVWTVGHVACKARISHSERPLLSSGELGAVTTRLVYRSVGAAILTTQDGETVARHDWMAEVIRCDEKNDIALLRLTEAKPGIVGSMDWDVGTPKLADPVICCGTPKGFDGTLTFGRVSTVGRMNEVGKVIDQADCGSQEGSSGGPICSEKTGKVIGLVQGGPGETCTTFVTARSIRQWAKDRGVLFAFEGSAVPPSLDAVRAGGIELIAEKKP